MKMVTLLFLLLLPFGGVASAHGADCETIAHRPVVGASNQPVGVADTLCETAHRYTFISAVLQQRDELDEGWTVVRGTRNQEFSTGSLYAITATDPTVYDCDFYYRVKAVGWQESNSIPHNINRDVSPALQERC